jgi:hypothetical protein
MRRLALLLKEKYGLVHVPSPKKAERWLSQTSSRINEGAPPEAAGIEAARGIFTHEFKPHAVYAGRPVEEILAAGEEGGEGVSSGNP